MLATTARPPPGVVAPQHVARHGVQGLKVPRPQRMPSTKVTGDRMLSLRAAPGASGCQAMLPLVVWRARSCPLSHGT